MFARRFSLFLAPSVLSMGVSFAVVPITTYVLGPPAFGIFGLMTALTAVGWTMSLIGSSAVCNMHFLALDAAERRRLVSTAFCVALAIASLFCVACLSLWSVAIDHLREYSGVPFAGLVLSMVNVIVGVPWMVAQDVITLDGKARGFAAITMAQTIAGAVVTVVGLYVFHLGVLALFISATASSAITCIGALSLLRPYLGLHVSRSWAIAMIRVGPADASSNVTAALQATIERSFIASALGVGALGLLVHAQSYRQVVAQVFNAAARPIWPVTLLESREPNASFPQTRVVWNAMYIAVTALGVTFAVLGRHIIGWLTHGRFADVHVLVTFLMVFILVSNTGKPQTAVLYREGAARNLLWLHAFSNLVWLGCLLVLVPLAGLVGAVLALIAQQVVVRIGIQILAHRYGASPMTDAWSLAGIAFVLAVQFAALPVPSTQSQLLLWAGAMAVLLIAGRRVLGRFAAEHLTGIGGAGFLAGLRMKLVASAK
ncbi:MAG TPA: oligosaccharide flippase family protein [Vicinamibacterales bacterium]|nr:oligosaccharide flippase family protein [Vicinamibacterales bacterium]